MHPQIALDEVASSEPTPLRVMEWHDRDSPAVGWHVIDRRIGGIAGGGVFMWDHASLEETQSLARTMTKKLAICANPIGGAKAGICCSLREPDKRNGVLRRFLSELRGELLDGWVTAADFGTSDHTIVQIVRELTGNDIQYGLFRRVTGSDDVAQRLSRRAADLYALNVASAFSSPDARPRFGIPLIEAASGYGIVQSILAVYTKLEPHRLTHPKPLRGVRIAVQGAGAVGTGVILYAYRLGAQIVAISDAEGIIYDSEGIDVEQLLSRRAISTADLSDEDRTGALKLLSPFADRCPDHDYSVVTEREVSLNGHFGSLGVDPKLGHMLQHALAVNVFVPAASRYLLNCRAIDIASEGMWKDAYPRLVVTGANNPFGTHDELGLPKAPNSEDRDAIGRCLRDRGIIYVPDFRSNGGTAQLFHCYASGELDWVLDETTVGAPVLPLEGQERVLQIVTGRIVEAVNKDLGNSDSSLLDLAACAEQRVAVQTAACQ